MPRGDNRVPARPGETLAPQKGPISQRGLVKVLCPLIDVAAAKVSTRSRDEARDTLRIILSTCHWQTSFVMKNLSPRRCRFLTTRGYVVPSRWLRNMDTEASINNWRGRQANG